MTRKLLFTLVLGAVTFGTALAQRQFTEVNLTVNGIRSGTSYRQVKKLGKPLRVKIIGFDECAGQYRRVLYFRGLEVGLLGSKDGKRSSVISLTITTSNWTIAPGIKIGASRASLIQKFGKPVSEDTSRVDYVTKGNLGGVRFYLRRGRLYRIEMMETLC
jgi:hypothetical protein